MTDPRNPIATGEVLAEGSFQRLLFRMYAIGLKVLKNKLSEYVRLAASGETVLVTDRDRVVAELVPPREGRSTLLADAQLADAVRQGWVTPPTLIPNSAPEHTPIAPLAQLIAELSADRGDR
ncbi:MAG: prevent-host-death protein [Gemmatimonadaceae bacterium]